MITICRATTSLELWGAACFVDRHHSYIRWVNRPSRKLFWSVVEDGERIGVFGLSSAYDWPKDVAAYMTANGLTFNQVANNVVFALHGSADKNAGTKALSLIRRDAIRWWRDRYGDDLRAFQTFIAPPRTGALYRADNWSHIGMTSGDGVETETLTDDDPRTPTRLFDYGDGNVRRVIQTRTDVAPKIILMRLVSKKEQRQAMALAPLQRNLI